MLGLRPNRKRQPTHESFIKRTGFFESKPVVEEKKEEKPKMSVGGDVLNWLLGYESTRFKAFLKAHGEEPITNLMIGRTPIAKAVRLGFDLITGGEFEKAHKKLGVDNFFHLFVVVNKKYRLEKNEVVNQLAWSKGEKEEDMEIPVKEGLTIDQLIQNGAKGNEKNFWLEYQPLGNNCQAWVSMLLKKNGLMTSEANRFVNQDMENLLKELPDYTAGVAKDMRMAADKFFSQAVRHRVEVEGTRLAGDLGMQHGLQQDVAEFIADLGRIAAADGICHLVGLFDDVWDKGGVRLLHVPRAATRRTQAVHDVTQAGEGIGVIEHFFHPGR